MAEGKITREALAEAVAELRAEVAALRAERAAHHCACQHIHWHTYPAPALPAVPYAPPYTITCESPVLTVGASTSVAAGVPGVQVLSLGN